MIERKPATEAQKEAIDRVCEKRRHRMIYLLYMKLDEVEKNIDEYIKRLETKFIL